MAVMVKRPLRCAPQTGHRRPGIQPFDVSLNKLGCFVAVFSIPSGFASVSTQSPVRASRSHPACLISISCKLWCLTAWWDVCRRPLTRRSSPSGSTTTTSKRSEDKWLRGWEWREKFLNAARWLRGVGNGQETLFASYPGRILTLATVAQMCRNLFDPVIVVVPTIPRSEAEVCSGGQLVVRYHCPASVECSAA